MSLALIESLKNTIENCKFSTKDTEWGNYYDSTNYSREAMSAKEKTIFDLIEKYVDPSETVHDFGANTGRFSRHIQNACQYVVAHDIDEVAVEKNYLTVKREKTGNVLPQVSDFTNPSAGLGWAHEERASLIDRVRGNVVLALALIHHLAISNNVPFDKLADFFSQVCEKLIIEFVPKTDSQVQRLLRTREDIFSGYDEENFEKEFGRYFKIVSRTPIVESDRTIYVMTKA